MSEPVSTTGRVPKRSDRPPQAMLVNASDRKPAVMAAEIPVRDQPVSREIGTSSTGKENMAPMATQPSKPPAATMTQRYEELLIFFSHARASFKTTHRIAYFFKPANRVRGRDAGEGEKDAAPTAK